MMKKMKRTGLSVIEVLSAMVVALIGVAGVLVLIPFSVKQAQRGLDYDGANSMAQNGIALFELGEHDRFVQLPGTTRPRPTWIDASGQVTAVDTYAIDPLGVLENGFGTFPSAQSFTAQPTVPPPSDPNGFPAITNVNLSTYDTATATLTAFSAASARRMFYSQDELIINNEKTTAGVDLGDLDPPVQVFDTIGGVNVRRQFRPSLPGCRLWCQSKTMRLGTNPPAAGTFEWKFEQHVLVYRGRDLNDTFTVMPIPVWPTSCRLGRRSLTFCCQVQRC